MDYNLDELDDIIEELAGPKAQAATAPSLAKENGDTMPWLGAGSANSCTTGPELLVSRVEWEQIKRKVASLSATKAVTKKLRNSVKAINR